MRSTLDHAMPQRCENCGASLHGRFCARCGQSVANPVRHAGHALEEVFESFWHLDGRVFRTLWDLLVPARVACNYLAGHRARYIAPLRLFVVLSVLTFFVGQMTVDFSNGRVQFGDDTNSISTASTVAEVERRRDAAVEAFAEGRASADASGVPGVAQGLVIAEARVREQAAARIAELQRTATPPASPAGAPAAGATGSATDASRAAANEPVDVRAADAKTGGDMPRLTLFGGKPWDAQTNPVAVRWLPGFANRWLNQKIGRALTNAPRLRNDPEARKRVFLGSVPTALFVLMPVFALLLKLAYLRQRRLYLEHLVVALYSHAFLLLALLAVFVMVGLEHWLAPHAPGIARALGWLEVATWWWMPIYLLIMQKRVYGQGWTMSSLKYFVLGTGYLMLVVFAAVFAGLAGLAKL